MGGVRRFLQVNAGRLGEDGSSLAAKTEDLAATFQSAMLLER